MRPVLFLLPLIIVSCTKPDELPPSYERVRITRTIVNQYPELNNGEQWDESSWDWSAPDLYLRVTDEYGIIYGQSNSMSDIEIDDLPRQLAYLSMEPDFPLDRNMVIELRDRDDDFSELVGTLNFDPNAIQMNEYGTAVVTRTQDGVTLTLTFQFQEQ